MARSNSPGIQSTLSLYDPLTCLVQIIARIQTPNINIRRNITSLLTDVGKHHPQALVYPLTVASKSPSTLRKDAALAIMDRMKQHSPVIVEQVGSRTSVEESIDFFRIGSGRQSRVDTCRYSLA